MSKYPISDEEYIRILEDKGISFRDEIDSIDVVNFTNEQLVEGFLRSFRKHRGISYVHYHPKPLVKILDEEFEDNDVIAAYYDPRLELYYIQKIELLVDEGFHGYKAITKTNLSKCQYISMFHTIQQGNKENQKEIYDNYLETLDELDTSYFNYPK